MEESTPVRASKATAGDKVLRMDKDDLLMSRWIGGGIDGVYPSKIEERRMGAMDVV